MHPRGGSRHDGRKKDVVGRVHAVEHAVKGDDLAEAAAELHPVAVARQVGRVAPDVLGRVHAAQDAVVVRDLRELAGYELERTLTRRRDHIQGALAWSWRWRTRRWPGGRGLSAVVAAGDGRKKREARRDLHARVRFPK